MFALRKDWLKHWVESCVSLEDAVLVVRAIIDGFTYIVRQVRR